MINPQMGGVQKMPENFARLMKRQAVGNDALLNPQKYGITYKFRGKEMVKDNSCLVLERVGKDGHITTIYLDAKTFHKCASRFFLSDTVLLGSHFCGFFFSNIHDRTRHTNFYGHRDDAKKICVFGSDPWIHFWPTLCHQHGIFCQSRLGLEFGPDG